MGTKVGRRRKYALAVVGALGAIAIIGACSSRVQVAYHQFQMRRAWEKTFAQPDADFDGFVTYTLGDTYERYIYHRQELVELGVVTELTYQFQHINYPSAESSDFWKALFSPNRPDCIDFQSPQSNDDPEPMQLTVWCYLRDAPAWDAFIQERDSEDYAERFIQQDAER